MAPTRRFQVISGGKDSRRPVPEGYIDVSENPTPNIPHGDVEALRKAAEECRQELQQLVGKSDAECSIRLKGIEGEFIKIEESAEGPLVYYTDLVHHNGKKVRQRLQEILNGRIKRLENDVTNILAARSDSNR